MLRKIINSGQMGVEQGALASSFIKNCETGGYIIEGYIIAYGTELKPSEKLKTFGLDEVKDGKLGECIRLNVENSDGTVIFVKSNSDITLPEKKAEEYCNNANKPVMFLTIGDHISTSRIESFIKSHNIEVLHVTGRIDAKESYCFDCVFKQMNEVFDCLKYKKKEI